MVPRSSSTYFFFILTLCSALSRCTPYRDFTLPLLHPEGPLPALRWELHPEPVLAPGPIGSWDSVDVLNPAIVHWRGQYYNLYSGFDGQHWHTGLAVSHDGIHWKKLGRVLSPDPSTWEGNYIAANGSALVVNDEIWYWYQAGDPPQIGLARSSDGLRWQKFPQPVLRLGPRGSWDERGVADPYVLRSGNQFYLYYLGQDRARRQRLGLAMSTDGIHWIKLRSNPILELGPPGSFDENGLGEPAVWASHGRYWMLYTGRDRHEWRRIGLAVSPDGVHWKRLPPHTLLQGPFPWCSRVVCDPEIEPHPAFVRVWFGAGSVPHPAENIHGRIGLAILRIQAE